MFVFLVTFGGLVGCWVAGLVGWLVGWWTEWCLWFCLFACAPRPCATSCPGISICQVFQVLNMCHHKHVVATLKDGFFPKIRHLFWILRTPAGS